MLAAWVVLAVEVTASIPRPAQYFDQLVNHFDSSSATYRQRFYSYDGYFGGPSSPIICIIGGEGAIPPETGIFYPWIVDVVAKRLNALVIEPEHRFYGESIPVGGAPFNASQLKLLTPDQALADAVHLIQWAQRANNCTARGTAGYCPVITIGGSYPGYLSAMMRLRYPFVVDMAYAASAPLTMYAQQIDQYAYYELITKSAERSLPGCAAALRSAFVDLLSLDLESLQNELAVCEPLPPYVEVGGLSMLQQETAMALAITFAGLNMENYPPTNATGLHSACAQLVASPTAASLSKLLRGQPNLASRRRGEHLHATRASQGCFNMSGWLPAGPHATISSGDWSGVGTGSDGESWDFETCTYLVEPIGMNNVTDAFPPRLWTYEWLESHCKARFGVVPQPHAHVDAWGFTPEGLVAAGASRILFTNGLNDGWSVGSVTETLSTTLVAINMPNGAHHSDLSHDPPSPTDTSDVTEGRAQARARPPSGVATCSLEVFPQALSSKSGGGEFKIR